MRLAIDASRANQEHRTGVETYALMILQELTLVIPPDVEVILYTRESLRHDFPAIPSSWKVKVLSWPPRLLWSQVRLAWQLWKDHPDAVYIPAHVMPFAFRGRVGIMIHDIAFEYFPQCYSWRERMYQRLTIRFACRFASWIFVPSEAVKHDLSKRYAVFSDKVHVIPHGFDSKVFHPRKDQSIAVSILDHYSLSQPYFLAVGRLENKKNTQRIIEAFDIFRKRYGKPCQLVLVGTFGYGYASVLSSLKRSLFRHDILLLGYVPSFDLSVMLSASVALLFPSWYEGFGLPVIEAQACGTAVITSDHGSLPEVAGDGALFVNPASADDLAEAMLSVIQNPWLRKKLIWNGMQNVRRFRWEYSAEALWEVLRGKQQ